MASAISVASLDKTSGKTRALVRVDLDVQHDPQVGDNGRVRFAVDTEHRDAVLGYLHELGIRGLNSQPPTLEQRFMRRYGDGFTGATSRERGAR